METKIEDHCEISCPNCGFLNTVTPPEPTIREVLDGDEEIYHTFKCFKCQHKIKIELEWGVRVFITDFEIIPCEES